MSDASRLWAVGALALVALTVMTFSDGVASDEEVFHYQVARYADEHPEHFISLGGRPLATTALFLPSQLGFWPARFWMAVLSSLTVLLTARLIVRAGWGPAWWGAALLLLQPFFIGYGSTTMTEPVAALVMAAAVTGFAERRAWLMALSVGLLPLARSELVLLLPVTAAVVVAWRSWGSLLLLPLGLVLWNLGGLLLTGDPLWLLHQVDPPPYPEREALHYVKSFVWITGLGLFTPVLIGGLAAGTLRGRPPLERRLAAAGVFVFLFLFAFYSYVATWRPLTFGNFRYLVFGSAPLALVAALGLNVLGKRRALAAAGAVLAVLGAAVLWNKPVVGGSILLGKAVWTPLVASLLWIPVLFAPRFAPVLLVGLGVLGLATLQRPVLHWERTPEEIGAWRAAQLLDPAARGDLPVYSAHGLMAFHLDEDPFDRSRWPGLDRQTDRNAPPGALWIWESHYTPRPGAAFGARSLLANGNWTFLTGVVAPDSTWAAGYFVRRGGDESPARAFVSGEGLDRETWGRLAHRVDLGVGTARQRARQDPDNPAQWRALADLLIQAGEFEEARRALDRAGELAPEDPTQVVQEAILYSEEGDLEAAREAVARAETLLPEDPAVRHLHGTVLWELGRREAGRERILDTVDRLPDRWPAQLAAANVYYAEGNCPRARFYYLLAIALRPDLEQAYLRAADCAVKLGNIPKAEEGLRALLRVRPASVGGSLMLGDILAGTGRPDEARQVWRRALDLVGSNASLEARLRGEGP